ncbi:unnamed protein product [Durusdinium trenchii]|uniref:BLUF domain-containing protein n=1 Tax=Durusdinium trenchii TaxID=1381693 RepID=A0ABP0LJJ7_9DINO
MAAFPCWARRFGFHAASFVGGAASAAAVAQGRPPRSSCRCDEPKMVTRISYTSTMRGDPQAALAAIRGIVDQSTAANLTANVSGHMCYDTKLKSVWQVLEGAPEVVSRLWEGICKDERHVVDEDTVHIQQADHRAYPVGWGMRCTRFEPGMASNSDGDCAGTNLMQLMYKSVIHEEALGSVKQIVPRAVEKNRKNGITGWMLYNDRTQVVYQVLEGPPEQVERLWTQIHKDGRHSVLTDTIRRRCIKEREFENWSMGFDEVEQTAWMASCSLEVLGTKGPSLLSTLRLKTIARAARRRHRLFFKRTRHGGPMLSSGDRRCCEHRWTPTTDFLARWAVAS